MARFFLRHHRAVFLAALTLLLPIAAQAQTYVPSVRIGTIVKTVSKYGPMPRAIPPVYAPTGYKQAPDLPFSYSFADARFEKAPAKMLAAQFTGNFHTVRDRDGTVHDIPLNFKTIPFWIYAQYRYAGSKPACLYTLMDGFTPPLYETVPFDNIPVIDNDFAVVMRDCGRGYETVGLESYGSVFDLDSDSYVHDRREPPVTYDVSQGLARDYARRLLTGLGGKSALQKKLDDAARDTSDPHIHIPRALVTALTGAGIRVAAKSSHAP